MKFNKKGIFAGVAGLGCLGYAVYNFFNKGKEENVVELDDDDCYIEDEHEDVENVDSND